MQKQIDGLTGLRGYAALWVMIFHMAGVLTRMPGGGNISFFFTGIIAVDTFFVLTGFLLFMPFAKKLINPETKISLSHYFKRRFLRIFPAYYVQMVILAGLAWWGIYENPPLSNWIAHIGMIHNLSSKWEGAINGVWWTLPVEMDFYLILPLLFLLIRKTNIWLFMVRAITIAISYKMIIFHFISSESTGYKQYILGQIFGRIDLFAWGMLGAFIYQKYYSIAIRHRNKRYFENSLILIGAGGIFLFLYVMRGFIGKEAYWAGKGLYFSETIYGMVIFLLIMGICLNGALTRALFSNKVMIYIGNISYSVYLWHVPLLALIFKNPALRPHLIGPENHYNMILAIVLFLVSTLIIATASFYLIERPCMKR